ncbi:MAG: hypothetical protein K1X28_07750 [Parachlamydiales bacterium]|nr:hypothetical protein [Parachlamydiales bacterium]
MGKKVGLSEAGRSNLSDEDLQKLLLSPFPYIKRFAERCLGVPKIRKSKFEILTEQRNRLGLRILSLTPNIDLETDADFYKNPKHISTDTELGRRMACIQYKYLKINFEMEKFGVKGVNIPFESFISEQQNLKSKLKLEEELLDVYRSLQDLMAQHHGDYPTFWEKEIKPIKIEAQNKQKQIQGCADEEVKSKLLAEFESLKKRIDEKEKQKIKLQIDASKISENFDQLKKRYIQKFGEGAFNVFRLNHEIMNLS